MEALMWNRVLLIGVWAVEVPLTIIALLTNVMHLIRHYYRFEHM